MVNVALVIFMVLTIILLFVAMVLSSMSAADISSSSCDDSDTKTAHNRATASAVISGLSVLAVVIALIIYFVAYRKEIRKGVHAQLAKGVSYIQPQPQVPPQNVN